MKDKKRIVVLLAVGLGFLVAILLGFYKIFWQTKKPLLPEVRVLSPTPAEEKLAKHEDEAGFSFEYPESLKIKDISGENDYAVLEIFSPEMAGKTIIRVVDSQYKSVEEWLKKAPEASGAGVSREITLGAMTGRQIQLENPRRLVTVAVDQGVLFYLESPLEPEKEGKFWNKVHNILVASFSLGERQQPVGGKESFGGEEVIYEEEEIVE